MYKSNKPDGASLRSLSLVLLLTLVACEKPAPEPVDVVRPIKIKTIDQVGAGRVLSYSGRVNAGESADLGFEVSGRIVELPVTESEEVGEGQLVARLDPADYQSSLDQASADFRAAEATFGRYEELAERGAVSRQELDDQRRNFEVTTAALETARKALSDTRLVAPFSGSIGRVYMENFQNVQAKQPVAVLQDITELEVVIDVPEQDWSRARPDRNFEQATDIIKPYVTIATFPGRRFPARITEASAVADPVTRTFETRLKIDNPPDVNLLPGMTATVSVTIPAEEDFLGDSVITVPASAVLANDDGTASVWKIDPASMTVNSATVEVAGMTGSEIRVVSGLEAGDRIAISGVHNLREGMQVSELTN